MKEGNYPLLESESDLIGTLYQALEWASRCEVSATRAENLRDYTLARFFHQLQQEASGRAEQTRELLQLHTGLLWDP